MTSVSVSNTNPAAISRNISASVSVSGGTAPYSNIHIASGVLPAGIALSSAGVLSGTPTAGGTFNFSIAATDSSTGTGPFTNSQPFTVTVKAPAFVFSPYGLAPSQVGVAYNQTVAASGGTAPRAAGLKGEAHVPPAIGRQRCPTGARFLLGALPCCPIV